MFKYTHKFSGLLNRLADILYTRYIRPKSLDEDDARREFIFNVLLTGLLALSTVTFLVSLLRFLAHQNSYQNMSPIVLAVPVIALLIIYKLSQRKFAVWIIYLFVSMFLMLGTYGLYLYSYILPQGLLIYALVIVISGILISARASFLMTLFITASLCVLSYTQVNHITNPHTSELNDPIRMNLVIYIVMFFTIYLVSWLSNREIKRSLQRARNSEGMLLKERDSLEVKVVARTRALEKAQVEKTRELYRFAEFGRLSSSLLHDLANPLTAVSLNLGQLENKQKPVVVRQIREGISHMEEYVQSARRQLNSQTEFKVFDSKLKIEQVIAFLEPKARASKLRIKTDLTRRAYLNGDSSKFSQIIDNLIANAIDSYEGLNTKTGRQIKISSKINAEDQKIIILIADKGSGIPNEELREIFKPFFTTKSAVRGTGIGLNITKRFVEDFAGTIEVSSSVNKGTSFTVNLPLHNKKDDRAAQ